MPAVHIRDLPAEVIAALKRRAVKNERSLEGELRLLLTEIAGEEPTPRPLPPLRLNFSQESPASTWRREEIYDDDGR